MRLLLLALAAFPALACHTQNPAARADLYACEGCEGALERDAASLSWTTAMAGADEPGERLLLRGVVRHPDGRPAEGVVVYAYHTNAAGLYAGGTSESEWSRRHGRLRGWARTGADGRYEFRTVKPGPYPGRTDPAHVHVTIVEPGRRPYWIDDVVFDGEFGVTDAYRAERENRGGDGIVRLQRLDDGAWLAKRSVTLERHPE